VSSATHDVSSVATHDISSVATHDISSVATHCPYCALQCAMTLTLDTAGGVRVEGRDFPTNGGGLCHKGWTSAQLLASPHRLTGPLWRERKDAPLTPVSWDTALDFVAGQFRALRAEAGADSVAVFGGGGLTNEKAYSLGKFARIALGTSRIDYNGRFCMSSAAAAGLRAFGLDRGLPFPVTDIAHTDVLMMVGSNVAETMPPFMRHVAAQRAAGGRLIVVDPRRTPTARDADLHLQLTPGTDLALALGLLHVVVGERLDDHQYIGERTSGYDAVRRRVAEYWPERVEQITGVPATDVRRAARMLGAAASAMILTARGAEQHSKGTDTVSAFINLALALGLPGRLHSGYGCVTGQGNGQGGRELGQKADQLPGYRKLDDQSARTHVAGVWGVDPDSLPKPGVAAYELLDSLGTPSGPAALLVMGSNPAVSAPRSAHIRERLAAVSLLVVCDPFLSETAELADVVLPVAQWAEESGTMTNLEGRVLRRQRLLPPPLGVRTDLAVLAELASRLGHPAGFDAAPETVFAEIRRATAGAPADYAGITDDRLDSADGVYWPCPTDDHGGTPRMFLDSFATADGRARFVDVDHAPVAEEIDAEYPTYLTTGRVLAHYQSGTQTRRVGELVKAAPEAFVELHPSLATDLDVSEGDQVHVISRRGRATAKARVTENIRLDTVFMPFHWAGAGNANLVTNPAVDPISGMPEFKVCAVRVERAES
jgi:assimilatory nitrate reductase catalytic subunit